MKVLTKYKLMKKIMLELIFIKKLMEKQEQALKYMALIKKKLHKKF